MKLTNLFAVNLLCLSLLAGSASAGVLIRGKIARISDGDTLAIMPQGSGPGAKAISVRLVSMDTPELHLPAKGGVYSQGMWGEGGLKALQQLIAIGDVVELNALGTDTYGRTLGMIYKGKLDINLEMVKSGWGSLYEICDAVSCHMESEYRDACRTAMRKGRGIFNPANPLPELPFLFRARIQGRPLSKFVGNYQTKKYVSPERYAEVPLCDRVFFITESDAQREGFVKTALGFNPNR